MAKYRAVLLVPTVVEFMCQGDTAAVNHHVQNIADGMGKTHSTHPKQKDTPNEIYVPKVLECVVLEGKPDPTLDKAA